MCDVRTNIIFLTWAHYSGTASRDSDENDDTRNQNQKNSKIGSSSCRCSTKSIGLKVKKIPKNVFSNSMQVRDDAGISPKEHWSFLGPGKENL